MHPSCICCGSDKTNLIGSIPSSIHFAGRVLDSPMAGGDLFRCLSCSLVFRYPRLGKEELDQLYCQGNVDFWQAAPAERNDWQIANALISRELPPASSILDVGCFDGGFLKTVGVSHSCSGIEIHKAACKKAQESGIRMIGTDFAVLAETTGFFDAVTSFDVIEHVHNPIVFLAGLAGATRDNGIVIVSSGNSDAPGWRLLGARYWYCAIGEHLSFINPEWCVWAAPRVGLELKQIITFSHVNSTWGQRVKDVLKNLFYAAFPRGFALLRSVGFGEKEYRTHKELLKYPPSWISAKDHCIYLFVKNEA